MDRWKYFGITHRNHVVCNPTSEAKIDDLVEALPLEPRARVVDFACGKAELLSRIVRRYDAMGVGVDLSPWEIEAANARVAERELADRIEIVHADGADYEAPPASFDLAMCIGATWIWNGYVGTIEALKGLSKPGGLIAIGEPFKIKEPEPEYAAAEADFVPALVSHYDNVRLGREAGLAFVYAVVSNQDDWHRYEHLQTLAAETWAAEHPDDPDIATLLERRRHYDDIHLRWARDTLNWAIYVFRVPATTN